MVAAVVAAVRRHPGPVPWGEPVLLRSIVVGLLLLFCLNTKCTQDILSVGGAGDGGDATNLLLEAVGHGFEGPALLTHRLHCWYSTLASRIRG
jgi:hypothetical protein